MRKDGKALWLGIAVAVFFLTCCPTVGETILIQPENIYSMAFTGGGTLINSTNNGNGFRGTVVWNAGLANILTLVEFDVASLSGNTVFGSSFWSIFNNTSLDIAFWTDDTPLNPLSLVETAFMPFDYLSLGHGPNHLSWDISALLPGNHGYLGFLFFQESPGCKPTFLTNAWLDNTPAAVPEPATILLLGSGGIGIIALRLGRMRPAVKRQFT